MIKIPDDKLIYSGSLLCMDPMLIAEQMKLTEEIIDYWHVDFLDGQTTYKRFGCYPEQMGRLKSISDKPIEAHMMVEDTEQWLPLLKDNGADIVSIHISGERQPIRTMEKITKAGMAPCIVANLDTTPEQLAEAVSTALPVMIEFMSINPGMVGTNVYLNVVDSKIKRLYEICPDAMYLPLAIDGGVRASTALDIYKRIGINYQVCGSVLYDVKQFDPLKMQEKIDILKSIKEQTL